METGMWVFRDGIEGASVNMPMFGRLHDSFLEANRRTGACDVMVFSTGDKKPMAGAIEMNQNLTDLVPIKGTDGKIMYYEKNFTSHQTLQLSMKVNNVHVMHQGLSSVSNYLYSAFSHRVKIDSKGQCIPIHFQRYVYFGSSCSAWNSYGKNNMVPQYVEYFYVVKPGTYNPGSIAKFDRNVPQLSCRTDFEKINEPMKVVAKALADGQCVSASKLDYFMHTCCKMTIQEYERTPACDLTNVSFFKRHSDLYHKRRIRWEICEVRHLYETGKFPYLIFHRDIVVKCDVNF